MNRLFPVLLVLAACGSGTDPSPPWVQPSAGEIVVETSDDLTIYADYYPASAEGRPVVVLLHRFAQTFDRTQWDRDFIDAMVDRDWTVMVPDRRGAGLSDGNWYDGEKSGDKWFDVEAMVLKAKADGYGSVAVVGVKEGAETAMLYLRVALNSTEGRLPATWGVVYWGMGDVETKFGSPSALVAPTLLLTDPTVFDRPWAQGDHIELVDGNPYYNSGPPWNQPGSERSTAFLLDFLDRHAPE